VSCSSQGQTQPGVQYSSSRCSVVVCPAANSDTGTGSKLLTAVHTAYTGYNALTNICNISTSRVQGGYRDTFKHHAGHIGDVNQASGWRDGRGKANSGSETADITEVVLIVDLHTARSPCNLDFDRDHGAGMRASRARMGDGYHDGRGTRLRHS